MKTLIINGVVVTESGEQDADLLLDQGKIAGILARGGGGLSDVDEIIVALRHFARMTATGPAKAFHLYPRKGAIALGFDADLAFYDPQVDWTVAGATFQGLGKWSAFEGMNCQGRVVRTLIRGVTVFRDGQIQVEPGFGQFITGTHDSLG